MPQAAALDLLPAGLAHQLRIVMARLDAERLEAALQPSARSGDAGVSVAVMLAVLEGLTYPALMADAAACHALVDALVEASANHDADWTDEGYERRGGLYALLAHERAEARQLASGCFGALRPSPPPLRWRRDVGGGLVRGPPVANLLPRMLPALPLPPSLPPRTRPPTTHTIGCVLALADAGLHGGAKHGHLEQRGGAARVPGRCSPGLVEGASGRRCCCS